MSRHLVIAVMLLTAALAPQIVLAADMEGKVQSVDTSERTFALENGTKIWLADGVAVESVTPIAVIITTK